MERSPSTNSLRSVPRSRIVDVREHDEWSAGHIPWAVHVPLATVPDRLASFDGTPTYVICKWVDAALAPVSSLPTASLDVVNVVGGMLAWERAGFDVVRKRRRPMGADVGADPFASGRA